MNIRNFDHLLLVKQLYQDALDSSDRVDRSLLTRALIILDLSVDLALKSILLNLDPDFLADKGKGDIAWPELWRKTDLALKQSGRTGLTEFSECKSLHDLRNLVQHQGSEPSKSDLTRYLKAVERMLGLAFSATFGLDFSNLRKWDFLENEDLRKLLAESEEFLDKGNSVLSIIGCKIARDKIVQAIRSYARGPHEHRPRMDYYPRPSFGSNVPQDLTDMKVFVDYVNEVNDHTQKQIERLEQEILLIGFGLSTADTRKFVHASGFTHETFFEDGGMSVQVVGGRTPEELEAEAAFMLNFLFSLLRALGESTSTVLSDLKVERPLSTQEIASYVDWFTT
jgi:hypothetical protein